MIQRDLSIKFLKAGRGDCILIRFRGDDNCFHNILIDGGAAMQYHSNLRKEILELISNKEVIDLGIITHQDDDHIKGYEKLWKELNKGSLGVGPDFIEKQWFNAIFELESSGTMISARSGASTEEEIRNANKNNIEMLVQAKDTVDLFGAKISVVSPNHENLKNWYIKTEKEWINTTIGSQRNCDHSKSLEELKSTEWDTDNSAANGSSIAIIFELDDFNGLFLGDALPNVVYENLAKLGYSFNNPIKLNLVKLSHHGGFRNISKELLNIINSDNYVISTSNKTSTCKPSKTTIAKITTSKHYKKEDNFIFNYLESDYKNLFTTEEKSELNLQFSNFKRGFIWKKEETK